MSSAVRTPPVTLAEPAAESPAAESAAVESQAVESQAVESQAVESQAEAPTGIVARLLVATIHGYQLARIGRVSPCRFTPTCSHYAVEAVTRHGTWRGLGLTLRRLGRCRPGGPNGYDPVPDPPSPRMRNL